MLHVPTLCWGKCSTTGFLMYCESFQSFSIKSTTMPPRSRDGICFLLSCHPLLHLVSAPKAPQLDHRRRLTPKGSEPFRMDFFLSPLSGKKGATCSLGSAALTEQRYKEDTGICVGACSADRCELRNTAQLLKQL